MGRLQTCDPRNITFQGEPKFRFSESRWLRRGSLLGQSCFLLFRVLIAVYWIGWVVAQAIKTAVLGDNPNQLRWFIYYTHWSAMLLAFYFLVAFLVCLKATLDLAEQPPAKRKEPPMYWESHRLPVLEKLMWLLHETSGTAQLVTVVIYWVLVYDPDTSKNDIFNLHVHGVGLLLWLLNTIVSNTPTRAFHLYLPFLYTTAYIAFTIVYFIKDGTDRDGNMYIYKALDYDKKPKQAAVRIAIVMIGVLPLGHIGLSIFSSIWEKIAEVTGGYKRDDPQINGAAQLSEIAKRRAQAREEV